MRRTRMKGKTLRYYTISNGDFRLIATKPLFALSLLGFWILKVNVDAKGQLHVFCGFRRGVICGVVPPNLDSWEKANRLLDETT